MQIVAVGNRSFVTGFQLAGVKGIEVQDSEQALRTVNHLIAETDTGLIILSSGTAKPIRSQLTAIRSKKAVPLIYEVPSPGSKQEKIEYRDMLKQILGV